MQVKNPNVKTDFLYGDVKKDLYMDQSPWFEQEDNLVCELQMSIYGLKQLEGGGM